MNYKLYVHVKSLVQDPNVLREETPPHTLCFGLQAANTSQTAAERRACCPLRGSLRSHWHLRLSGC